MEWGWGYARRIVSHIRRIVREVLDLAPVADDESRTSWMDRYGSDYRFTGAGFDERDALDDEDE